MKKKNVAKKTTQKSKSKIPSKKDTFTKTASAEKKPAPRFSEKTFEFIKTAARQKKPDWLDKNREAYEESVLNPLRNMAQFVQSDLADVAKGYRFPQKGIGRLKRPAHRAADGGGVFRSWISYSASRPAESRFDHNPNLYFMIDPEDEEGDEVLIAGGLYMASSRQVRALREAIAADASEFKALFASKAFKESFKGGFSEEKTSSRNPRGFDPNHAEMKWLRLQAFFVWKSYSKKEFFSADFPKLVAKDWKQIVRLNDLMDRALVGTGYKAGIARNAPAPVITKPKPSDLLKDLAEFQGNLRKHDFED